MNKSSKTNEFLKRLFKYIVEFLIVAASLKYVPQTTLETTDIVKISIIAVVAFAILDMYYPAISTRLLK